MGELMWESLHTISSVFWRGKVSTRFRVRFDVGELMWESLHTILSVFWHDFERVLTMWESFHAISSVF